MLFILVKFLSKEYLGLFIIYLHYYTVMESDKVGHTKSKILDDIEYWYKKMERFEKTNNPEGMKVAKMMIDKYLDSYNDTEI